MNRAQRRAQERARRKLKPGAVCSPFRRATDDRVRRTAQVSTPPAGLRDVFENSALLVFLCDRPGGLVLLMIQRKDGGAGLSWDDLQWVKGALGFEEQEAIELYPPASRLVNDANMRHLWLLPPGQVVPFGLDPSRAARGLPVHLEPAT